MGQRSSAGSVAAKFLRATGLVVAAATIASGCASDSGDGAQLMATDVAGLDGPVVRHREPVGSGGDGEAISGTIILEGQCLYLGPRFGSGERFPIVWPSGTRWDAESRNVVLPNGDPVEIGDTVFGGGGFHDVESVAAAVGDEAADLVDSCLENTYGEVAVMNNFPDAIRGS